MADRITELLLRQGDISAEQARRSGATWAGVGNAVGETVAGAATAIGKQKEQAKRDVALTQAVESWDGRDPMKLQSDLMRIGGPDAVHKLMPAVLGFHKMKGDASREDEEAALNIARALKSGDITQPMWDRWAPQVQTKLKPVVSRVFGQPQETPEEAALRAERDPAGMEALPEQQPWTYQQAIEGARMLLSTRPQEEGEGFTLSPGQQRFGPDGKPIATAAPEPPKPPKAPELGTLENFLVSKYGTSPTPEQQIEGRTEWEKANDRPQDPGVQQLMALRLEEAQRAAGAAKQMEAIPGEWRGVIDRVSLAMPKDRRAFFNGAVTRAWEGGDQKATADYIRQAAIEGEDVETRKQILGRMAMRESLNDTAAILKEMQAKGVPTNWFVGTAEDLARKLGTSTNPEYVELSNRLAGTLINYRRAATGAAFSDREGGAYEKMFPNYKNTLPVNLATIAGLTREADTYDRSYWTHKLGPNGAALLGVSPGAPRGGASDTGAKPKGTNPYRKR